MFLGPNALIKIRRATYEMLSFLKPDTMHSIGIVDIRVTSGS